MINLNSIIKKVGNITRLVKSMGEIHKPLYRVVNIQKDNEENYLVEIQLIGKSTTFTAKPEKLLMDDAIVNLFSPCDIRNLTYLGYLGINAPKYKILAQKPSIEKDQTLFALVKKGEKKNRVVTASKPLHSASLAAHWRCSIL